uniref:Synaptotagmin-15-like n=1 Tax=Pundamilia nyererei TaxID=303518 RepID=A0A3B4F8M3_9CICH
MAGEQESRLNLLPVIHLYYTLSFLLFVFCSDHMLQLAVGLSVGVLLLFLLLILIVCYLRRRKKEQMQYEELLSAVPSVPACSAPVILVSQGSWATLVRPVLGLTITPKYHIAFIKLKKNCDILLFPSGWYPVGTVLAGLYSVPPLNEVVAPPPGMVSRLCFSVEYRHSSEQLMVFLLRLSNLPPRFHGNVTMVELRLLPDDRRPRQAKARGTGPDPEFTDCFIFQVSALHVLHSTLSVCVLSVEQDGKRHVVGRVLFSLEGEFGQAGRVLWRDLETEEDPQCSELGDVQISLSYSTSLQRLSVVVLRARGIQLLTDAGVCVQVSLQKHTQVVKMKRSCVVKGENDPYFNFRSTFKLRPQHLDEACVRFELQQPSSVRSGDCWTAIPASQLFTVLSPFYSSSYHHILLQCVCLFM